MKNRRKDSDGRSLDILRIKLFLFFGHDQIPDNDKASEEKAKPDSKPSECIFGVTMVECNSCGKCKRESIREEETMHNMIEGGIAFRFFVEQDRYSDKECNQRGASEATGGDCKNWMA